MSLKRILLLAALTLSGCAVREAAPVAQVPAAPIQVQLLAINDFHGNIRSPADPVTVVGPNGNVTARMGGAAELAAALEAARNGHPDTLTVAAGDLVGASPLESAYFLDEPTIDAMTMLGLSVASVGNHEFDKGSSELLRMANGGCEKYTSRTPCQLERFKGAGFDYLAANVVTASGKTLFPPTAIRQVGPIRIGFIGETLKDTATLVAPGGVAGLHFADEAETANALVPGLKAAGVDTIVLLLHQGGKVPGDFDEQGCDGLTGDILPILGKLDPAITTVISGHTHNAYACTIDAGGANRLLTSAGKYGYLYTDVELTFDPSTHRLLSERAANVPVTGAAGRDPKIAELVKRYTDAAAPAAARVVGHLPGPLRASVDRVESPAADLIADAQLAATRAPDRGGAEISFINTGGVRTSLDPGPGGAITYGQIFAVEPFGNDLVVTSLTGAQIKALLEQQFVPGEARLKSSVLVPSANFRFTYDISRPEGGRIVSMLLDGKPLDPNRTYRVSTNNFLASGGDGYSVLTQGTGAFDAGLDLVALEGWLATDPPLPSGGRMQAAGSTP